uniref:Sodium channel modifier 1 n=1 Tax=Buteo japonicus TaxID=224669 RepID=A0A8C0B837_9AVES
VSWPKGGQGWGQGLKRRVADLLANYIPEDEALLLRSGRYACTVCAHRPIFDTLDVLTVHRAGKKHMGSLQRFYGRKRSLQDVAQKRQHEEEVQAEETAPLLARTRRIARNALLKAAPYSSCCRRTGGSGHPGSQPGLSHSCGSRQSLSALPDTPKAAPAQTQQGGKGKASSLALSQTEALSPERRQALERYLQLRSAGWIQDRSGKWVKDENAEFDSDEDEPPVLLPA